MRRIAFLISLSVLVSTTAWSAPATRRPLAGAGVVSMKVTASGALEPTPALILYQEPGVGRLADLDLSDLPSLSPSIPDAETMRHSAATRKKGNWVKIIFDDSGREGWLEMRPRWLFQTWSSYLKGAEVKLLNGLRKSLYLLRAAPSSSARSTGTVSRERILRVVELDESWMLVLVDLSNYGWLRWKDDDGRLLISVEK